MAEIKSAGTKKPEPYASLSEAKGEHGEAGAVAHSLGRERRGSTRRLVAETPLRNKFKNRTKVRFF